MDLDDQIKPEFSRPFQPLLIMILGLGIVGAIIFLLFSQIETVFKANLYLNGFIVFVFGVGVLLTFWQVFRLSRCVSWIEGFVSERKGFEFVNPPGLLASMAVLLRDKRARRSLTSNSSQTILDSVATRMDESRDFIRYIVGLLIFLGLLGTFWGLSNTVPAVVDTIRSLAPQEGQSPIAVFDNLMTGLESQLGGMGTAFASSLLGLAGSLVVGFLELQASQAQNRFFREFEDWISSITRITGGTDGDGVGSAYLSALLEQSAEQMDSLYRLLSKADEKRSESDNRLAELANRMDQLASRMTGEQSAMDRIADGQDRIAGILGSQNIGGMDEETRNHIRNMDVHIMRMLEELAAGRQDTVNELRSELKLLSRTIATVSDRAGKPAKNKA